MEDDIKKACLLIKNYLNVNDSIEDIYSKYGAVAEEIVKQASAFPSMPATQIKEGNMTVTYAEPVGAWKICGSIKDMLPKPFIKTYS